jgi:mRNA interferase RelE/StbE
LAWKIDFDEQAADEFRRLDRQVQRLIYRYLIERIATNENPRRFGCALKGNLAGLWRYRVGDYRVICDLKDDIVTVIVLRVGHRKDVY